MEWAQQEWKWWWALEPRRQKCWMMSCWFEECTREAQVDCRPQEWSQLALALAQARHTVAGSSLGWPLL